MKIDLHVHTKTGSDGNLSIEDVFEEAKSRGVELLSITDHDSVDAQATAISLARGHGISYITGVELNVTFQCSGGKSVSMDFLGYGYDIHNSELNSKLQVMKAYREKRARRILENLNAEFDKEGRARFTEEDLRRIQDSVDGVFGRPHIANYLIEKGFVKDKQEAFDRYLAKGNVPKYPLPLAEASGLIRNAGGILVLAHPNDPNGTSLVTITQDLKAQTRIIEEHMLGYIDGIECWHSRHDAQATQHYVEFAGKHSLIMTGGSDCHQAPIIIGTLDIPGWVAGQFMQSDETQNSSRVQRFKGSTVSPQPGTVNCEPLNPGPGVRRLSDRSEILSYLERERSCCAAAIAHLEPDFWGISKWFVAKDDGSFALCLISRSMSPRYIMTMGNEAALDCLLDSISLPEEAFITCRPKHLDAIQRHYELEWHRLMKRMVAVRESFSPVMEEATRLRAAHWKEANKLGEAYTRTLSPRQLGNGVFYGIYREGQLVAVAGTDLISPTYSIAYLEDVLVHPAYRNQGLAAICASAVAADLFRYCTEVVISVEPGNLPAVKAYAGLGFRDDCLIVEAMGRRHSFVGAIITNLWKRFRWNPIYEERTEPHG